MLKGPTKDTWNKNLSNEWGNLDQGNIYGVFRTYAIDFVHRNKVPRDRDVTYATYVLNYKPLKDEKRRVCITVIGYSLTYPYDAGSLTANIIETKVILNSTISDARHGSRFISADI